MANTTLTKTFGSAGNQKTWTWSGWIKRGNITSGGGAPSQLIIFANYTSSSIRQYISFNSDQFYTYGQYSGVDVIEATSSSVYRDTSAWYHIVIKCDTTQGTASDRFKVYVNGSEISLSFTTTPSLDVDLPINDNGNHYIGSSNGSANYFDGSMAMVQFVDGTALGPEYFGSTDSTTGIWTPQASSTISSYGTNGFKLKMDTATPGADTSGNTNNFTVGTGTPTLTQGSPSNVYATLNPLIINNFLLPNMTYVATSEGNNTLTGTSASNNGNCYSTLGASSGKFYCEVKVTLKNGGYPLLGIMPEEGLTPTSSSIYGLVGYNFSDTVAYQQDGNKRINSSTSSFGDTYGLDDIIGIAMDLDNGAVYFSKNGIFQNSGNPTSGASKTGAALTFTANNKNYFFGGTTYNTDGQIKFNFGEGFFGTTAAGTNADGNGQGLFAYAVPSGYYALNTKNLEAYG